MPGVVEKGLSLLRSLLGTDSEAPPALAGLETSLRGAAAVAVTEACVAELAGLGAGAPADILTRAWEEERWREEVNLFGQPLGYLTAPTPRGVLAGPMGMSLSGARASAFLSAPNLAALGDLLTAAAGRNLPVVVHVVARALHAHAGARGSGHEAWHVVADAGALQFFARNVQEAADFALIGRRVAEQALQPVLVGMDEEQTAAVTQDVRLPGFELVQRFLGRPEDVVPSPTMAQQLLFGRQRRRVPRWYDLERPVLHGAVQGRDVWALGAAARRPYGWDTLLPLLDEAWRALARSAGGTTSWCASTV